MNQTKIDELAQIIWDYHKLNQPLEKADCLLVLGSHDLRVAEYATDLFLKNYAPVIIFSGGIGRLTEDWQRPEAEIFSEIAQNKGAPKEKIFIENKSTNTGENIQFSYKLIQEQNLNVKKIIIVQKPYMERRVYTTFKKQWPDKTTELIVTSPPIPFQNYCNDQYPKDKIIAIMMGDFERIKTYPEKGFQIYQEIPKEVIGASSALLPIIQASKYSHYLS